MATFCVFIAAFTGVVLSYVNVQEISVLMNTHYGMVLLAKILLVGIIAIIGGLNKFFVIPNMNNIRTEESSVRLAHGSKLLKLVTLEATLGFVVLLLTSILTHLSPEG